MRAFLFLKTQKSTVSLISYGAKYQEDYALNFSKINENHFSDELPIYL